MRETGQLFHIHRPDDQETPTTWAVLVVVVLVGATLRFWGLDNLGLHGDEDVMALATRGILDTGSPYIPSGMYYGRALPQLYLMAVSVYAFGDSEWALRLPSAIAGTLSILIAYWLARRFLTVRWSIAFATVIAFLPTMITLSQTARMYVFYVAFVMLFVIAIFRWERTESTVDWSIAVVICFLALSFQSLAIFSALLFFYPGLVKGSQRLLGFGAVAFVVCAGLFKLISSWISSLYFPLVSTSPEGGARITDGLQNEVSLVEALVGVLLVVAAAGVVLSIARKRRGIPESTTWLVMAAALFAAAAVLAWLMHYHMAALGFFLGAIFYVRSGSGIAVPATIGAFLLAAMATHAVLLWQSPEVQTTNDLLEALAGMPKPLPYYTFFGFSPLGVIAYAGIALCFGVRFARGNPLPDHVLFFLIAVFAPLFLMGFFEELYMPARYLVGFLPLFILSAFAGILAIVNPKSSRYGSSHPLGFAITSVILIGLFVGPIDLWYNVNPHSRDFRHLTDHRGVDHKGAAEFVIAQGPDVEDLVIVVDAQQQGYYLRERMDYYMRSLHDGRNSSFMRDQQMLNLYTGTPQISTGEELAQVLLQHDGSEVLIVGSGELEPNRMRYMSDGIWETMQEFSFDEVYLGRDGATRVWRHAADGLNRKQVAKESSD